MFWIISSEKAASRRKEYFMKIGSDKAFVEMVIVDIFRDLVYIRYSSEELRAANLDEFNNIFSTVGAE